MLNLNDYFNNEYHFALREINYNSVENKPYSHEIKLNIADDINTTMYDNELHIDFCRNISFTPESLYNIKVLFSIIVTFRDNINDPDYQRIDWNTELSSFENPYISNVASRASNIISSITAAYGQQPLITPPNFIKQQ